MRPLMTLARALQLASDDGARFCESASDCLEAGVITLDELAALERNEAARYPCSVRPRVTA